MTGTSKRVFAWLGAGSIIFVVVYTIIIAITPQRPPALSAEQQKIAAEQQKIVAELADKFTSDLIEHMYQNHSGATWYPLIKTFGVSVDLAERTFSVRLETIFPPQDAASRPVMHVAGALMSWSLGTERDTGLALERIMVFGRKAGGELIGLRSWDGLWGWRNW